MQQKQNIDDVLNYAYNKYKDNVLATGINHYLVLLVDPIVKSIIKAILSVIQEKKI